MLPHSYGYKQQINSNVSFRFNLKSQFKLLSAPPDGARVIESYDFALFWPHGTHFLIIHHG